MATYYICWSTLSQCAGTMLTPPCLQTKNTQSLRKYPLGGWCRTQCYAPHPPGLVWGAVIHEISGVFTQPSTGEDIFPQLTYGGVIRRPMCLVFLKAPILGFELCSKMKQICNAKFYSGLPMQPCWGSGHVKLSPVPRVLCLTNSPVPTAICVFATQSSKKLLTGGGGHKNALLLIWGF